MLKMTVTVIRVRKAVVQLKMRMMVLTKMKLMLTIIEKKMKQLKKVMMTKKMLMTMKMSIRRIDLQQVHFTVKC